MPRVRVEWELDPDYVDVDHPSGITEEANDKIIDFVMTMGDDFDIKLVTR